MAVIYCQYTSAISQKFEEEYKLGGVIHSNTEPLNNFFLSSRTAYAMKCLLWAWKSRCALFGVMYHSYAHICMHVQVGPTSHLHWRTGSRGWGGRPRWCNTWRHRYAHAARDCNSTGSSWSVPCPPPSSWRPGSKSYTTRGYGSQADRIWEKYVNVAEARSDLHGALTLWSVNHSVTVYIRPSGHFTNTVSVE